MNITRWTPFQELEAFQRRIPRFFEDIGFYPAMLPAADVYEKNGEFVYELEVPGFEEKDLTIEISDHVLAIKGDLKEKEEPDKLFRLHERLERHFERRFEIPPTAETEKLTAEFKQGVLSVRAPLHVEKPRKVPIG
ncbi:MAG: Hsp20/alpha crystallin family protein [Gaiellaceae bacterium]